MNEKVKYRFQSGLPDFSLFPMASFRSALLDVLRRPRQGLLDYSEPQGWPPLIQELTSYLRRTRNISDRPLAVTHGSQEGLYIAAQLLVSKGDEVAMEEVSYPPAREIFSILGAKITGIRQDQEGLDIQHLKKVLETKKIKCLFLTPTHQFPTTRTLFISSRMEIYRLAEKYGVILIEDDYDHEYHYDAQSPAPMASSDPAGIVVYLSTFSKGVFPSARIGVILPPKAMMKSFLQYRRLVTHQNDSILQDAFARWIESGHLERHLRKTRRIYQERRDLMHTLLLRLKGDGKDLLWTEPGGGLAFWVNLQRNSFSFARKALEHGIFVHPEKDYRITDDEPGSHIRLGFSNLSTRDLKLGLEILGAIL